MHKHIRTLSFHCLVTRCRRPQEDRTSPTASLVETSSACIRQSARRFYEDRCGALWTIRTRWKKRGGGTRRYRVGDCRIVCEIQGTALCVLVVTIGKRREVYR